MTRWEMGVKVQDDEWEPELDSALAANPAKPESAITVTQTDRKCRRHEWEFAVSSITGPVFSGQWRCSRCGAIKDEARARRGKQSRNYGNRAELDVARRYGGEKVGHHGGPVDVRGKHWNTQVKTHRRKPPAEWTKVFSALEASTDRLPRLLLRFVFPGGPEDFYVVPSKAWLEWYGRDDDD